MVENIDDDDDQLEGSTEESLVSLVSLEDLLAAIADLKHEIYAEGNSSAGIQIVRLGEELECPMLMDGSMGFGQYITKLYNLLLALEVNEKTG
jgi:hypothetical protein